MKYKLIASDLDGTLLASNSEISVENELAIKELTNRGVICALATGRTLCELTDKLRQNENIRYVIYSNGAAIHDKLTGERIVDFTIRDGDRTRLIDVFEKHDAHYTLRHNGICYTERKNQTKEAFEKYKLDPNHSLVTVRYSHNIDGLLEFARTLDHIEVMSAYFATEEKRNSCAAELKKSGLHFAYVKPYGLEVFSKDAGKGAGLKALCEHLGIGIEECIGVGDSGNDITLIEAAGLGLATANAAPQLISAADETICTNDGHIVKHILENYF